jgi:hypothetical protein
VRGAGFARMRKPSRSSIVFVLCIVRRVVCNHCTTDTHKHTPPVKRLAGLAPRARPLRNGL